MMLFAMHARLASWKWSSCLSMILVLTLQTLVTMPFEERQFEIVKLLVKDPRVDPSGNKNYAIRMVSKYGHSEVVRILLSDPHVDPSANYCQALQLASLRGRSEIMKYLLRYPCADPTATTRTPKETLIFDHFIDTSD